MRLPLTDSELEKSLRLVIVLRQPATAVDVKRREFVLGGRYPLIRRELIETSGLLVAFRKAALSVFICGPQSHLSVRVALRCGKAVKFDSVIPSPGQAASAILVEAAEVVLAGSGAPWAASS